MGSADASLALAARPAFTIDGQVDSALAGRLIELLVHEDVHGLCRCEAVFNNWGRQGASNGFLYFDRQTLDFGKRFGVRLGDETVFDGRIVALAGETAGGRAHIRVHAEDALLALRTTRRSRCFVDSTDAAVFRRLAQDHGLTAQVDALTGPTHALLLQLNQTDLGFLRERAGACGAVLRLRGGALEAGPRSALDGAALTLAQDANLRQFDVIADLTGQPTTMVVSGWDVGAKQAIRETADDSVVAAELGRGTSAASLRRNSFGERSETLAHAVPASAAEAQALARAQFGRRARRFVSGRGTAAADPALRVGAAVTLAGVGALFDGRGYCVTETRLRFDGRSGLRTEFAVERAALGPL